MFVPCFMFVVCILNCQKWCDFFFRLRKIRPQCLTGKSIIISTNYLVNMTPSCEYQRYCTLETSSSHKLSLSPTRALLKKNIQRCCTKSSSHSLIFPSDNIIQSRVLLHHGLLEYISLVSESSHFVSSFSTHVWFHAVLQPLLQYISLVGRHSEKVLLIC